MRRWLAVAAVLFLGACGFQLRGSYTLPFDTLYINLPETNELRTMLARSISAGTSVTLAAQPRNAQATLVVVSDASTKNILALSAAGRAREFRLQRTFTFRVVNPAGLEWLKESQIVVYRDMTYSDDQVLSKGFEETLLWRDIQSDLTRQVLRRLSVAKAPVAPEPDQP